MADSSDKSLSEMVREIESKDYKVLTRDEYEALINKNLGKDKVNEGVLPPATGAVGDSKKPAVTSTPSFPAVKSKFTFHPPGVSPIPRLQQILNNSQLNTSYIAQPITLPKLPFFSGAEEITKGETSYEVWSYEVKCLQKANMVNEDVLKQTIRNSLKGFARSMLVPLGEDATVSDILNKLDGFYGNVSSSETLIQDFYSDSQKESESIVQYASRIEQTLSRAIRYGHIDFVAKDAMLRSKFWTGLKSQQLKNSTRHMYDTIKDFQTLLKEVRKVEQEDLVSIKPSPKQKSTQQHSTQAAAETKDSNSQLLQQMTELMERMKAMERKLEQQQEAIASAGGHVSFQAQNTRPQSQRGRGGSYSRGNYKPGFGRGYQSYHNDGSQNTQVSGVYQNHNRGGGSRGGHRGGANGRGTSRGGNAKGGTQPLNF